MVSLRCSRRNTILRQDAQPQSELRAGISGELRLTSAPSGPVTLRVRHYDSDELVQVPFELSTGIGL